AVATDGTYRIAVTAKGPARSNSGSVSVTVDTTPPTVKLVNLTDGQKLKNADLVVQGITEGGATVQFADSGETVAADNNGGFTLHRQLEHGTNTFKVLARDASGNQAEVSRCVDLLDRPPAIKLDSVADDALVHEAQIHLYGLTDPGVKLSVQGRLVAVDGKGHFDAQVDLAKGLNTVRVEAQDQAGNLTTVERKIRYDLASSEPLNL